MKVVVEVDDRTDPRAQHDRVRVSALVHPFVFWVVVCACVLSALAPWVAWWAPSQWFAQLGVIVFACVCGAGISAWCAPRNVWLFAAITPAASMALVMVVALAQVMVGLWFPPLTATLVGGVGCVSAWVFLRRHQLPALSVPKWRGCAPVSWLQWGLVAAAWGCWIFSLGHLDLDSAGGAGLVGVLPVWFVASFVLLATSVAVLSAARFLGGASVSFAPVGAGLVLVVCLCTISVNVVDQGAVMGTGYVHVGFVDAFSQRGAGLTGMDARFSWPGFFVTFAVLSQWAGMSSVSSWLVLYPAVIVVVTAAALVSITRSVAVLAGASDRVRDLASVLVAPIFLAVAWGQQDYFSPQSLAVVFYAAICAVLIDARTSSIMHEHYRWWRGWAHTPGAHDLSLERRRVVFVLFLSCALVVSHQLTPVALILVLAGWSVFGQVRMRALWLSVGVIFSLWFAFGATDWWTGNLSILIEGFGKAGDALERGVVTRATQAHGDEVYALMQRVRIVMSAVCVCAAGVCWFFLGKARVMSAVMVVAPVLLVFGQAYGGEIAVRIMLYMSVMLAPVLAVGTALLYQRCLMPRTGNRDAESAAASEGTQISRTPGYGRRVSATVMMGVVVCGVIVTAVTLRGVNLSFERTPHDVIAAARTVLSIAPNGATVRPLSTEGALRHARVGELHHPATIEGDADAFTRLVQQAPDYVFLTSMRENYEHYINGAPLNWYEEIAARLEATNDYRIIIRSAHVIVLERLTNGRPISTIIGVDQPQRLAENSTSTTDDTAEGTK